MNKCNAIVVLNKDPNPPRNVYLNHNHVGTSSTPLLANPAASPQQEAQQHQQQYHEQQQQLGQQRLQNIRGTAAPAATTPGSLEERQRLEQQRRYQCEVQQYQQQQYETRQYEQQWLPPSSRGRREFGHDFFIVLRRTRVSRERTVRSCHAG